MPNENKKVYAASSSKSATGTIPKVKQRNNNVASEQRGNLLPNNLDNDQPDTTSSSTNRRNPVRNLEYFPIMDGMHNLQQNGHCREGSSNGIPSTPNDSHPASRRNSSGLSKCDNVSKYPDKKQIENKLSQIQEYLHVATAIRANMKNTDEQMQSIQSNHITGDEDDPVDAEQLDDMIDNLLDSETKLKTILNEYDSHQFSENGYDDPPNNKNELEYKVDVATRDLQMLKEQENLLLHLQLNAEKQLREARHAQAKLAKGANAPPRNAEGDWYNTPGDCDAFSTSGTSSCRNVDLRELEERIRSFNVHEEGAKTQQNAEQFQQQIDQMQSRIMQMRDTNDNRSQLIQILDARDAQLQSQHSSLQGKLQELHNKKSQVDQLAVQLQRMNENHEHECVGGAEEDEGMHMQVKKIVNMKEQLAKLKDMLNMVQSTEDSMDRQEYPEELEENVNRLIAKTDNLMMQQNRVPHVENVENTSARAKEKQVNKKSMNANEKERLKIQAELRAKRRELEELMCKHKAANSNLNHDVVHEKNSEMGANTVFFEHAPNAWYPMDSNIFNTHQSSESDDDGAEEEANEYLEPAGGEVPPMPVLTFPTANYIRQRTREQQPVRASSSPRIEMPPPDEPVFRSPVHSATSAARNPSRNQLQKQLELIKSVCDSMLETTTTTNTTQSDETVPLRVRNNLTPSPIYSEPRHFSPRPNVSNSDSNNGDLNMVTFPECHPQPAAPQDSATYNNWLATNALQTQTFILNTLNQCCQMLWHQQKELLTLRNTVNIMQDRFGGLCPESNPSVGAALCMQSNPCIYQSTSNFNNFRPKANQHQAAGSGSMPNLNGHYVGHHAASNTNNHEQPHPPPPPHPPVAPPQHACCNNMMNNAGVHMPPPVPPTMWNGQALNNQVPPGNRANNYWDNFRSYSRQNLLSTKSNDGTTQNIVNDRSLRQQSTHNDIYASAAAAALPAFLAKSNSNHNEAQSLSVDNSPRRRRCEEKRYSPKVAWPDCAELPSSSDRNHEANAPTTTTSSKSILFEELRENVYKEVASLISANEGRPHFLIQLFRDLQLVSSDPVRRNILQSIQGVISGSLNGTGTGAALRQQILEANVGVLEEDTLDTTMETTFSSEHKDSFLSPLLNDQCVEEESSDEEGLVNAENINSPEFSADAMLAQLQQGELAEADQRRAVAEGDEGAVGGLIGMAERSSSANASQVHAEQELRLLELWNLESTDESEQGLDQVPTRLSNPPSIGCSPKSQ